MHVFPTLYSRTSTGAVQTWFVTVDGDKYFSTAGQIDGVKTVAKPTVCKPKNVGRANETTAEEQAMSEAKNKFKKKLKEGYFENIADIDIELFTQPMLAKNWNDRKDKVTYPLGVQIKFNGMRCIIKKSGMFTRKGEPVYSCPHIRKSLDAFFDKFPTAVLDSELFNYEMRQFLNEIMSLCRKTVDVTQEDLKKSEKLIRAYIYDGYDFDGITPATFYRERAEAIKRNLGDNPYYRAVKTYVAKTEAEIMAIYEKFVADDHEGGIIRLLDMPYENKRSSALLKLKPLDDAEGKIIAIIEGEGGWTGQAAKATIQWKDKTFDATFKGKEADKKAILLNQKDWIGKEVTFLYNSLTGLGVPNFARIDIYNCFKS